MANNNNPIRPAILTQNPPSSSPLNTNTLSETITRLVSEALQREGRAIINSILNPEVEGNNELDQTIEAAQSENLDGLDKIPDVVKSLREFSGNQGEFGSWRKSVERILKIYQRLIGTPKYYGILSVIRNKIVGHADVVLESYNTPLNWSKISKCLTLHYADKRDLGTLEYQMTTLIQGNTSLQEFYQTVYHHLSLILNKLSSMEITDESMNNLIQTYRDKALDTFVRGLRGDLPRLLSIKEPTDLPQALHLCMKLQNVDFRVQYANSNTTNRTFYQQAPPIPHRRHIPSTQYKPTPAPRQKFQPELYHDPRNTFKDYRYFQNRNPPHPSQYQNQSNHFRNLPPKPMPKPEPMDIDQSMNSRAVNYQNRPRTQTQPFTAKRDFPQSLQQRNTNFNNKYQRVHNTEQQNDMQPNDETSESTETGQEESDYNQTYLDNLDDEEDTCLDPPETLTDIYFLGM